MADRHVLAASDDPDYTLTRALAHWRTRGHRRDAEWEPLPDDERRRLINDFAADAVAEAEDVFLALSADGSARGPVREILTRVLAEGVDLHDRDAVDRVIGAYSEQNARRLLEP